MGIATRWKKLEFRLMKSLIASGDFTTETAVNCARRPSGAAEASDRHFCVQ